MQAWNDEDAGNKSPMTSSMTAMKEQATARVTDASRVPVPSMSEQTTRCGQPVRSKEQQQRYGAWYRKQFSLWLPKHFDFEGDQDPPPPKLVPVEEILMLLVLKNVRTRAWRRLGRYTLFMVTFFIALVYQRDQTDAYLLESAIQG